MIQVEIEDIVRNIGKNIGFLQPAYEAIVNSLEANATEISIEFFQDNQVQMDGCDGKLNSFVITDNGDGFNDKNIKSFKKLWSAHKIEMGCKGSGRFTWLNVFKDVCIKSELAASKQSIEIPFSLSFDVEKNIAINNDSKITQNRTTITFQNLTESIYNNSKDGRKRKDLRDPANLNAIHDKIFNYLWVKLFLLKKQNKSFKITIQLNNSTLSKEYRIAFRVHHQWFFFCNKRIPVCESCSDRLPFSEVCLRINRIILI